MQSQSLTRSDGVGRSRSFPSFIEYRRKRVPKTPKEQKIPGLEISDTATEKLELLVSLNLGGHPDTKAWKIKAAHELAIRYIAGDQLASPHKTPFDPVKAYDFASMEINNMSIRELEAKFFQLETGERHVN